MDSIVGFEAGQGAATRLGRGSLRDALWTWAQVSAAGIGGSALQIATMHRLLVERKKWISEERFFHALAYCIAMPGPETQQLAIYIGWLAHRTIGGVIAGGLFVIPGVICMMALSYGYVTGAESQVGQAIFMGVKPAILAIMATAILRFGRHVLRGRAMAVVAGAGFIAAFVNIPFLIIVIAAAVVGLGAALAGLRGFERRASAVGEAAASCAAEHRTDHTQPNLVQFIRSLAMWLALWLTPSIVLLAVLGTANIFTQISLVFSKVALMAIGGDYAVIAAAAQQVVEAHHWLSAREMQEGIAMGEMVPGTIMIVTQFLGFVAAYRDPGSLPPMLAGACGGLLAAWTTFAPCFLWILVIAPFIEGLRGNVLLNATLQSVTAAAVGMILNLSVWFGIRTVFQTIDQAHYAGLTFDWPSLSSLDPWALVLSIAAAIAMLRFNVGAIVTLCACSAVGLLLFLLGVAG